ncbi:hypothetical protein PpBr36_09028 [Pyricularia pennisetigena]|uniref:hypothetical protein n=1 Tax=Pyricularia pennisetigena TaxID=1578925 RepID=UPI0011521BB2|nr:hypothetical protein PpBr36_09028 [Pyricularia pennisetigena]TLS24435.1 hypothetical protein PpBr36_09028 [Pyricularia pennisetigena]
MKPTRPLALIKNIFESYRDPLPLDQNEKTKLYRIITKSFRKQLDKELGLPAEQSPDLAQRKAAEAFEATFKLTRPSHTETPRASLGSQHLRSILSNPLFSYDASKAKALRVQGERDPMDVFEEAAARGLMTPIRAAGCLKAKRRQIMQSSAMDPVTVMASSSAGQRVVEWLRSSGLEKDFSFLGNQQLPFLKQLIPFMIAEGMEKTVWVWLDMLSKDRDDRPITEREFKQVQLFGAFVEHKYQGATSMNNAYACMKQVKETFPWDRQEKPPKYIMTTWQKVAWESTVMAWKHLTKASPRLFESFYTIGKDNLDRQMFEVENYHSHHGIDVAHLALHHPTKPNAEQAVKLLLDDKSHRIWKTWKRQHQALPETHIARSTTTVRMRAFSLDTIKVCASQGQTARAEKLLQKLAPYLGNDFRVAIDEIEEYEDAELFDLDNSAAVQ